MKRSKLEQQIDFDRFMVKVIVIEIVVLIICNLI